MNRDLSNVEWFLSTRILSTDCLHLHATAQLLVQELVDELQRYLNNYKEEEEKKHI